MRIRKTTVSAAGLAAALALSACSSAPPPAPPPTTIQMTVVGAAALNPDPNERPSPVMLRLYQLGPSDAFANADFFQVIDQDKATLGPTLLDRQELAVPPDSRQTVTIQPKPDVKTLAVAAAFRAYEKAGWRAMLPIEPNKANTFVLTAKDSSITLARQDSADGEAKTDDGTGTDKPDADKPDSEKPGADKPGADKPAADKPAASKSDAGQPAADAPKADKGEPAPKAAAVRPAVDQPPAAQHNLIIKGPS
ncbi:type VI secretion system lipoprotein TssJ [Azospirillum endophyticum]|nr:type VI secretion system lipoprotein TssJ [Azospirillum endophyticum]